MPNITAALKRAERAGVARAWEKRQLNVFADANLDYSIKLALARDLERLYSSLVAEPIPPNLGAFTDCLGRALEERTGWRTIQVK